MEKKQKTRNPVARACRIVNRPVAFKAKKGRGSFSRKGRASVDI